MKLIISRQSEQFPGKQCIIGNSNASLIILEKKAATKVLKSDSIDMLVHEYQILKQLNHPNIIRLATNKPFKMIKELNKLGLQLELGHIDLFKFLNESFPSRIKISIVKDIFRQLADALLYLHEEKHIAHNDIKLENILLFFKKDSSKDFTQLKIKLIDFGLASQSQADSNQINKNWSNRSPNNLSPEIIQQINKENIFFCQQDLIQELNGNSNETEKFDLSKSDVFQFGLTLFNTLFLCNPFTCENGISNYQCFINNSPSKFWSQSQNQEVLQMLRENSSEKEIEQIIDLFNIIFRYIPSERSSIKEIRSHPWFSSD